MIAASVSIQAAANQKVEVVLASEVEWEPLNPARGDKSPKAATLWGDRKGSEPTGFLVKFADGFSSPPHIHNVSYRGVVIHGLVHNDDPYAAKMWMPVNSFWTQPRGEVHITAAKGSLNLAYIEIEKSPYLVLPIQRAFDSGERPINLDASNIVWHQTPRSELVDHSAKPVSSEQEVAFLWGRPKGDQLYGAFIKLPAGFIGEIHTDGSTFRGVIIKGQLGYLVSESDLKNMEPGSYFSSVGDTVHSVSAQAGEETTIYVRTNGSFEINSKQSMK